MVMKKKSTSKKRHFMLLILIMFNYVYLRQKILKYLLITLVFFGFYRNITFFFALLPAQKQEN